MTFRSGPYELLPKQAANRLLVVACALILCGIPMAGLSPFTPHLPNQVHWLDHGNGLHFGKYATILSVTPLHLDGPWTAHALLSCGYNRFA